MIDDPLGLVVQAIALLAAGMYPVGFLFGTCSDCCCPPCGRCTHYANELGYCSEAYARSEAHTLTFNWADVDVLNVNVGSFTGGAYSGVGLREENSILGIDADQLPELPQEIIDALQQSWEESNIYNGNPLTISRDGATLVTAPNFFTLEEGDCPSNNDNCSCPTCCPKLTLEIRFNITVVGGDEAAFIAFQQPASGPLGECSQTTVVTNDLPWEYVYSTATGDDVFGTYISWFGEFGAEFGDFIDDLQEWLYDHPITAIQMSDIPACECGACCEPGGDGAICTDNVAEGDCVRVTAQIPGIYLGTGTTCENDGPCPTGSCCDPATGNCAVTPPWGCEEANYTEDAVCDPNPCPQPPTGACCDREGNCTQTTEANCGGDEFGAWLWIEGVECDPSPCPPPPTGACCDAEGGCTQTTNANCQGRWREGVECNPDPCVYGWCCGYIEGVLVHTSASYEYECAGFDTNLFFPGEEVECPPTP